MTGLQLFLSVIALLSGIYIFSKAWFFPGSMVSMYKRSKKRMKSIFPFVSNKFIDLLYFKDNQRITIGWSRVMATLYFSFSLFIFIATISQGK